MAMAGVFRCLSSAVVSSGARAPAVVSVRFISGKALRVTDPSTPQKPAPWPYKEKPFRIWHRLWDSTTARFDENTKVIVVDGPVAAGKSKFARALAAELDMLYFPEANLDMLHINQYGYDLRQLDDQIPPACRSFDVQHFCRKPTDRLAASLQLNMYTLRYSQYIDALAHVLSTGQGVVLDRSVYSDFVFAEAMMRCGYMSRAARSVYEDVKKNTIGELMRPHLAIYLDVPVDVVRKRIEERGISYERNSPIYQGEFLTEMEHAYKQQYLPQVSKHAELLVYDWSQHGDVEVVVEDVERLDFDKFGLHDKKMEDWRLEEEEEWCMQRALYADRKQHLLCYLNVPRFDVPELITEADDIKKARDVWNEAPGEEYAPGFNANAGDTGVLFKMSARNRGTLPMIERTIPAQ